MAVAFMKQTFPLVIAVLAVFATTFILPAGANPLPGNAFVACMESKRGQMTFDHTKMDCSSPFDVSDLTFEFENKHIGFNPSDAHEIIVGKVIIKGKHGSNSITLRLTNVMLEIEGEAVKDVHCEPEENPTADSHKITKCLNQIAQLSDKILQRMFSSGYEKCRQFIEK